jgi:flagellar biosynthesis protein FlhG
MKPTLAQEPVPPRQRSAAPKRVSQAPVFAVTSGKGGVGKTNVVANLAAALALRKKRVMVIDADLGLANLDLFLGVRPAYTLVDFFTGLVALNEIIIQNRNGILLLPGACGTQEVTALRHDQKIALLTELDALSHEVDVVLVDTEWNLRRGHLFCHFCAGDRSRRNAGTFVHDRCLCPNQGPRVCTP